MSTHADVGALAFFVETTDCEAESEDGFTCCEDDWEGPEGFTCDRCHTITCLALAEGASADKDAKIAALESANTKLWKAVGVLRTAKHEAESDERHSYPPAAMQINAPLAMIQVGLQCRIDLCNQALEVLGDDAPIPTKKELAEEVVVRSAIILREHSARKELSFGRMADAYSQLCASVDQLKKEQEAKGQ